MGTQQDFTEGSVGRAIVLLAVPMVLEMSMESLFGIADVFFVSRLGAEAVATVGLTESILTLLYAIAMGLSLATSAMVARRVGEKKHREASRTAVQGIILAIVISLPLAIFGAIYARSLLKAMGASDTMRGPAGGYAVLMFGGNITIMLLFLNNAIFRGAGDAATAMRALWIANLINIVLDPCLIFGLGPFPALGVPGAAVATNIGRGVGVAYQITLMMRSNSRVRVELRDWKLDVPVIRRLLRIALAGIFQYFVATASWLGLVRIIAIFGSTALAGYTIALRIIIFSILPSWGMSNAAATLVGQNLGAGKPDRAERSVWLTGVCNMIFLGCVALVFIIFARSLVRLFSIDPSVIEVGADCLRLVSFGYLFYGYGMVIIQAFNGAGDTDTPTMINLGCYWLFQIPLAYALAILFDFRERGVFIAITMAESLLAVVGILVFRTGRWKEKRV